MAIFDANKTVTLTFYICLTDPVVVAAKQAMYPEGVSRAPADPGPPPGGAAVEFEAPFRGFTQPAMALAPFTWTPWRTDDTTNKPFPLNVATFQRHTGGFWGIGGTTIRYNWRGMFVLASDPDGAYAPGEMQACIPVRRWVEGFETSGVSLLTGQGAPWFVSKDAARHVGGMGLAVRGFDNKRATLYLPPAITRSWERMYVRLRRLPTATNVFWYNLVGSSAGTMLGITPDGQINISTISDALTVTQVAVVAGVTLAEWTGRADEDVWHRIDIVLQTLDTGGASPCFHLYVDGVQRASVGALAGTRHFTSNVGERGLSGDYGLYLDVDDWHNAEIPGAETGAYLASADGDVFTWATGGVAAEPVKGGLDWLNGSKIVLVRPNGFAADHSANWAGDSRVLSQNALSAMSAGGDPIVLTTSSAVALCAVATDDALSVTADPGALGVAAMQVVALSVRGTTSGTLGYRLGTAAPVMAAIVQNVTATVNAVMYTGFVTGTTFPVCTPIELRHAKGGDASLASIASLLAHVELCGKWGRSDYTPAELAIVAAPPPDGTGPHNYPYPRSPWASRGLASPIAPYIVKGGIYVGNGTGQDLTFRTPVHWVLIRAIAATAGGYFWLSTLLASHREYQQGIRADIVNADEDPTFAGAEGEDAQQQRYRVRIAGAHALLNQAGVTYQYIAISDPAMRYMLNGVLSDKSTLAARTQNLISPDFSPEFGFFFAEEPDTGATAIQFYAKAAGQAAASMVKYQPAVLNNAVTFALGALETQAAFHGLIGGYSTAYSLWRAHDGGGDSGEPGVVKYGSYTGDGATSRTFDLTPASGRRPLFAFIFAQSGSWGYSRDPSHTATNSSTQTGVTQTNGIIAGGIDAFTVGVGANATGVVYSYFLLWADATAGNNGWGVNGEYAPVEAYPVPGGAYPSDPTDDGLGTDGEGTGDGGPAPGPGPSANPWPGGPPTLPSDFSAECYKWSTYLGNVALSRIGVGKQIEDLRTDGSEEGYKLRLHYALDMEQTLRDHPWPFATRYADLVRVAGTATVAVNKDWQYSYRAPTDLAFARRIVSQDGDQRAWDPDPPTFRVGADATGPVIYTNAVASTEAPVQLEYTLRLPCPAATGDAIFRTAFIWKLAASLALSLARDAKKAEYCEALYQQVLSLARATGAKEQQQEPAGEADWITGRE